MKSLNALLIVGFGLIAAFVIIVYRIHVATHGGGVGHW